MITITMSVEAVKPTSKVVTRLPFYLALNKTVACCI